MESDFPVPASAEPDQPEPGSEGAVGVERILDGSRVWTFDSGFLSSHWQCIWGKGCPGIEAEAAAEKGLGCCSVGAQFLDQDEAMETAALAATLDSDRFQFHAHAEEHGIFSDQSRTSTLVVEGGCVFLNRPGFAGGAGCALHLAALDSAESPIDWKPSVCWQLPVKVDHGIGEDGAELSHLRAWSRADWGEGGTEMAWCCTEDQGAFGAERPVIETLEEEITALTGAEVYQELRRRIDPG